ncbi:MAG: molybdopterin-dependent oxidoreductase [Reyranellaceae bacterium]
MEREHVRTTCPRDCYDGCGIVVVRRQGQVRRVLGDPEHPVSRGALCGKCAIAYNGVWRDPAARLATPLKRVGAKGEGRFAPVSWDAALADIAARLKAVVAQHGAAAVANCHYTGTCSVIANNFPQRFFNRLGATEADPDTVCNQAGYVALELTIGTAVVGFDPRTAKDSNCVLLWGVNPSASGPHAHKYWLPEARGAKIVVDPVRTETAAAADLHLQPRPGSDAALAFGLLHVLIRDRLTDPDFIAGHTLGFDEVAALAAPCTPAWTERQTGVSAALVERAASLYGRGPALLWLGQGLQRQPQGGNIMRACALLPAVTGNIGKPGAGLYYLNGKGATRGLDMGGLAGPQLRAEPVRKVSHMDLAQHLADAGKSRALFVWNMNIAASVPNQRLLHQALRREDLFTVVVDLFETDTARFADYVLPAASFLEFDDLVGSYFHLSLGAQAKVMEPLGQSLPNQEIFRRLARAMGYSEPALYESDEAIIAAQLQRFRPGLGFEELKQAGTLPVADQPVILHRALQFDTPSGHVELASDRAVSMGLPRTALPTVDAAPRGAALRLLSPAGPWLLNSSYGNDPRIRQLLGGEQIVLHPQDAAERQLRDGQAVVVRNDFAALPHTLRVADIVPRGTALTHKTRWARLSPAGLNVNALNPGLRTDMGDSTALHGVEVEVVAA